MSSSQLFYKVLVFVVLHLCNVNAFLPYPYAQQFGYNYQIPQYQPFPNYGQQMNYPSSYPMYPNYQSGYGQILQPQYPSIPLQGGIYPGQGGIYPGQGGFFSGQGGIFPGQGGIMPGQGGIIPAQGGIMPSQGSQGSQGSSIPAQGGVYPAPFPHMPQSFVQTPYGNIPVEIIDVNPEFAYSSGPETNTPKNNTQPSEKTPPAETSFTEEKKNFNILRKPVISSSVVQSSPQSTTITRTFEPQHGKIDVTVITKKPPVKNEDNSIDKDEDEKEDDENEIDNETTTKKYSFGWL